MKKIYTALVLTLLCISAAFAGVRSIMDTGESPESKGFSEENIYKVDTRTQCAAEGYYQSNCPETFYILATCPYASSYVRCCPQDYMFTEDECTQLGLKPSDNSCYGKYSCM